MPIKTSLQTFRRQQLADWIREYNLDCALRDPEQNTNNGSNPSPNDRGISPPAPGQIRLLPPANLSIPAIERPVFVLLLPSASEGNTSIIPFSRFSTPATQQEWLTGLRPPPLRVLCLWNVHVCKTENLHKSWHITPFPPKKLQEVLSLLHNTQSPKNHNNRQLGPPLQHPLDPRHIYLQEERTILQDLINANTVQPDNALYLDINEPDIHLLKAAEPPPDIST